MNHLPQQRKLVKNAISCSCSSDPKHFKKIKMEKEREREGKGTRSSTYTYTSMHTYNKQLLQVKEEKRMMIDDCQDDHTYFAKVYCLQDRTSRIIILHFHIAR